MRTKLGVPGKSGCSLGRLSCYTSHSNEGRVLRSHTLIIHWHIVAGEVDRRIANYLELRKPACKVWDHDDSDSSDDSLVKVKAVLFACSCDGSCLRDEQA